LSNWRTADTKVHDDALAVAPAAGKMKDEIDTDDTTGRSPPSCSSIFLLCVLKSLWFGKFLDHALRVSVYHGQQMQMSNVVERRSSLVGVHADDL
jgi:hypothetical protein